MGLCVKPILNVSGSCIENNFSSTRMEWARTAPADAVRSQSFKLMHPTAWHSRDSWLSRGDQCVGCAVPSVLDCFILLTTGSCVAELDELAHGKGKFSSLTTVDKNGQNFWKVPLYPLMLKENV